MEWQLREEKYTWKIIWRKALRDNGSMFVNAAMYQKQAFRKIWVEGHSWKVEHCTVSEIKSFRRHKVKWDWETRNVFNFWVGCCFPLSIHILIILGKRLCICKVSCSISFQSCQRAILFPLIVLFITAQLVHSWQHKKYPPVTGLLNSVPCFLYCLYQTLIEKHYYWDVLTSLIRILNILESKQKH